MSPVAAGRFTCTTSAEVRIACSYEGVGQFGAWRTFVSVRTNLVGKDKGEFDFVGNSLCVATSRINKGPRCPAADSRDKTKRRHSVK